MGYSEFPDDIQRRGLAKRRDRFGCARRRLALWNRRRHETIPVFPD